MNPSPKDPNMEQLIAKLRKYGLDRQESPPHLIISGNLSNGEGIWFKPKEDCRLSTPFSTEIVLRHGEITSLTVRLIPDFSRPASQKSLIKTFQKSLAHLGELPNAVYLANKEIYMILDTKDLPDKTPWKDVLRIEIEGPSQPHLTLLDIPSLLGNISKIETGYEEDNAASIAETSFTAGSNTPTHTAITEDFFSPPSSHDTVPHAGKTFMIRDRNHGGVITLKEGILQVSPNVPRAGGCHWTCIERDGWFGFRNCVSGQFFGHDNKGKFHCKVQHHRNHEWFCTRAHPEGGHLLLMLHGDKFRQMKIGNDDTELVETDGEGTAWDFIEV